MVDEHHYRILPRIVVQVTYRTPRDVHQHLRSFLRATLAGVWRLQFPHLQLFQLFTKLFDDLEQFYGQQQSSVSLNTSLNSFFHDLYRTMFSLMHPMVTIIELIKNVVCVQLEVSDLEWRCMRPTLADLKPFGDIPEKTQQQVRRSLVAARSFVFALESARDLLRDLVQVEPLAMPCTYVCRCQLRRCAASNLSR